METIESLSQKIDKLECDHKAYVEFSAGCFIGVFAVGIMIDHTHNPFLWLVLFILTLSLIVSIVIAVKQDLKQDALKLELEGLQQPHESLNVENTVQNIAKE